MFITNYEIYSNYNLYLRQNNSWTLRIDQFSTFLGNYSIGRILFLCPQNIFWTIIMNKAKLKIIKVKYP